MTIRMRVCRYCGESFQLATTGRPPRYCSATCRKKAWEKRRLDEAVAVAVAKAVAAEQRRAANRGNETPRPPDIRRNETPSQARSSMQPELPLPDPRLQIARPPASLPSAPSLRQRRRLLPPPPGAKRPPESP